MLRHLQESMYALFASLIGSHDIITKLIFHHVQCMAQMFESVCHWIIALCFSLSPNSWSHLLQEVSLSCWFLTDRFLASPITYFILLLQFWLGAICLMFVGKTYPSRPQFCCCSCFLKMVREFMNRKLTPL